EKNSWIEPNFSSCSEMIYTFKEINNLKLSIKGALPIYIGMVIDYPHKTLMINMLTSTKPIQGLYATQNSPIKGNHLPGAQVRSLIPKLTLRTHFF
ncbi:MAG: hypothetical protein Q8877_02725, partial [Sweet potato little leaf phytoplasma]|nr:hypothetical protein [Sweet potato little leaf phytoplasma]